MTRASSTQQPQLLDSWFVGSLGSGRYGICRQWHWWPHLRRAEDVKEMRWAEPSQFMEDSRVQNLSRIFYSSCHLSRHFYSSLSLSTNLRWLWGWVLDQEWETYYQSRRESCTNARSCGQGSLVFMLTAGDHLSSPWREPFQGPPDQIRYHRCSETSLLRFPTQFCQVDLRPTLFQAGKTRVSVGNKYTIFTSCLSSYPMFSPWAFISSWSTR